MTWLGTAVNRTESFPVISLLSAEGIKFQETVTSSIGIGIIFFASYSIVLRCCFADTFGILITVTNTVLVGNDATIFFVFTPALRINSPSVFIVTARGEFSGAREAEYVNWAIP